MKDGDYENCDQSVCEKSYVFTLYGIFKSKFAIFFLSLK